MPDISPYGVTQNAVAEQVTANQLVGERSEHITTNAVAGSAAAFSTAPYRPDIIGGRRASRIGKCLGKKDTCMSPPMKSTDLCWFHTPDAP
jgi:hypothetical protein